MKTLNLTLLTVGVSGLLLSAVPQNRPGDNNPQPQPAPGLDNTNAPGGELPPSMPEDIASTNGVAPQAGEAQGPQKPSTPVVILPGQSKPAPSGEEQPNFVPPPHPE